jgi:hypothetical protein
VISLDVATNVLKTNVRIIQAYSLARVKADVWHNYVDGGGIKSGIDSKHLQKTKMNALIVCSSFIVTTNVST